MSVSRGFLVCGSLYLLFGILVGMYMGGSGDHTLAPAHAHINLLGFTLMTIFGILYLVLPEMAASGLARVHFWLHQVGAFVLLVMLMLFFTGRINEAQMVPVAPLAEAVVFIGILCFAVNIWRNAR
ncbi:MAG: hypothetical protein WAT77_13330 [Paracoccaceae bacterium]|jgi:hypothetical protein